MARGFLGLIVELHHPLPGRGEQPGARWAEAAADTYWPLLRALVAAADAGLSDVATVAVSPSWAALAADPVAQELAVGEFDRRVIEDGEPGWSRAWSGLRAFAVERWERDPIAALRRASASGAVELIPTTSSHAWLPSVVDDPIVARAQVTLAALDFAGRFETQPQGMWLPHLGYRPGLERFLGRRGLRYFGVDAESARRGTVRSPMDLFGPLATSAGSAAFAVDPIPCAPLADRARHHQHSPPRMDHAAAIAAAAEFAGHWVAAWRDGAHARAPRTSDPPPINVSAISADHLGGKWTLGAEWLERVLFNLSTNLDWPPTTPSRYLDRFPEHPLGRPGPSAGGLPSVRPHGSDLWERLLSAAELLNDLLEQTPSFGGLGRRAFALMVRSLLLAQSLDWETPIGRGISPEEGLARAYTRLADFHELAGELASGAINPGRVAELEAGPAYLPDIHPEHLVQD
jgi:1,4-alpha-glucan branching enzyme